MIAGLPSSKVGIRTRLFLFKGKRMKKEELEDLVNPVMEAVRIKFEDVNIMQEEDLVTYACLSITETTSEIAKAFVTKDVQTAAGKRIVTNNLGRIICWTVALSWLLDVGTPLREELQDKESPWQPEVRHDGILATTMIQYKTTQLMLDYFLAKKEPPEEGEEDPDFLLVSDIFSLVEVLALRLNIKFEDLLNLSVKL